MLQYLRQRQKVPQRRGEKDKRDKKRAKIIIARQKKDVGHSPSKGKIVADYFLHCCASSVPSRRIWMVEWSGVERSGKALCPVPVWPEVGGYI